MSRTIETSGAALAALCIAGVSSQANAATVTYDLNLPYNSGLETEIGIDSTTPQFNYNSETANYKTVVGTMNSGAFASSGLSGSAAIDSSLTYAPNHPGLKVAGLDGLFTGYVQLAWTNDSNVQEYGYATFTGGDLTSITGDITSVTLTNVATPLPASWALLASGSAVFGLIATRRRRRRQLVS
jgi:hypothetical protein